MSNHRNDRPLNSSRRQWLTVQTRLAAGLGAASLVRQAGATGEPSPSTPGWPSETIRFIVPYQAGGATDATGRLLAERLSAALKQPIIVDNRVGASGNLGTEAVVRAKPDGNTWLVGLSTSMLTNQFLFRKLAYNPSKDLALASQIVEAPIVLAVHPSLGAKDVASLRRVLGQNKGKYSFGSWGVGSAGHLTGAHLSRLAGADLTHIAYKGEAPMAQDLVGGQIPIAFASALTFKPFIDNQRIVPIGVTGTSRMKILPDVPTLVEQGLTDDVFRTAGWVGLAAPKGTPTAIIDRVAAEVRKVCEQPEVQARLEGFGFRPVARARADFQAVYDRELPIWKRLVEETGATLD